MKCNVGGMDRVARIVVGVGIIIAAFVMKIWWLYIVGAIPLLTGLFGFCCLYTVLGINTSKGCSVQNQSEQQNK